MANAQNYEIRLLGQRIPLKASEADPQVLEEVVKLVSDRLADAEEKMTRTSKITVAPHQVTLLALLRLAEEYVKARQSVEQFQREVQEKTEDLVQKIEAHLK